MAFFLVTLVIFYDRIKKRQEKLFFKNLVEKYKSRYTIPYLDLADAGESNRLIVHIASIALLAFSVFCLIFFAITLYPNYGNYIPRFTYYTVFFVFSFYTFFASKQGKDVDRNKAYIKKTIPFYVLSTVILADAVFTVKVGAVFNGFIIFCITGFIALCTCSFSPLIFLLGIVATIGFITPDLIENFGVSGYLNSLITAVLMFCLSLYKRRSEKRQIMFLKKQKQSLEAKTFGNFTLMYENKVVKFTRTKSDELMGYLIYKKGSSVKTKELISVLYGEHADSARYGSNFRNLIVDIKRTLGELGIQNFFVAEYNNFRINPEVVKCDYYDFLAGEPSAIKKFAGEFMSQFSWAEEAAGFLEQKALKKN
jgi:hypothetical protein